jgi:hypothetical protein
MARAAAGAGSCGNKRIVADFAWTKAGLSLGTDAVSLDDEQRLRINFVGPPDSFPMIPFHEALTAARAGTPLPQDVGGALVIIGVTAHDQQD